MASANARTAPVDFRVVTLAHLLVALLAAGACVAAWQGQLAIAVVTCGAIAGLEAYLNRHALRRAGDLDHLAVAARNNVATTEDHFVEVLRRVIAFVEEREGYRRGHSSNVGRLGEQIARKIGLPEERCTMLGLAGQLHDIGLMVVPTEVLNSRSKLSAKEFGMIKRHSEASYEVLKPLASLATVLSAVRYHHERMNGTGYPAGLRGAEIPLDARILAVADAYDAMTHDRPYRDAMSPVKALTELRRCSPAGYDPDCVRALGKVLHIPRLQSIIEPDPEPAPAN